MSSNFACNRQAFTAEQRQRHFEVLSPKLLCVRESITELSNGYELKFPADAAVLVTEWAEGERRCCPFLNIEIAPDPLTLRVTGKEGVKQFIKSELPQLFDSA